MQQKVVREIDNGQLIYIDVEKCKMLISLAVLIECVKGLNILDF